MLVVAALLVGAGTVAGTRWPCSAGAAAALGTVFLGLAAAGRRRPGLVAAAALCALAFASAANAGWRARPPRVLSASGERAVEVCGTVLQTTPHSASIEATSVARGAARWRTAEPAVLVGGRRLEPGWRVCASGRVVRSREGTPLVLAARVRRRGTGSVLRLWAGAVRRAWARAAERSLPPRQAGLLLGMTDGDTSLLDRGTQDDFRTTGLAHLVAVSGYNVAVFLALVHVVVRPLARRRRWARTLVTLPALVVFAFLTGLEPSVLRAATSAGLVAAASGSGRTADALRSALAAFVLLVLASPSIIGRTGFQLSFAAALGIVLAAPRISVLAGRLASSRVLRAAIEGTGTTVAAQLAVAPLLAWHVGRVPGLGTAANVVGVPLAGMVMIGGLVTLTAGAAAPALAWAPATLRLPLDLVLVSAHAFAHLPGASLGLGVGVAVALALFGGALAAPPGGLRLAALACGVASLGAAVGGAAARPACPDAAVAALDIGQGTAVLLREGGHDVLVDAGPEGGGAVRELRAVGVRRLDALVLSHAHVDHALGALDVLDHFPVGGVWGPEALRWASGGRVLEAARQRGVPIHAVARGDEIAAGPLRLEVLWPPPGPLPPYDPGQVDAHSLAVRAAVGGVEVLLPGDVREDQQQEMARLGSIRAGVLVAPHHGSRRLDPGFVGAVGEHLTLVTVGQPNPYGLPAREALRAYARRGPVFRTDREGRVLVCLGGEEAEVKTAR